MVGSNPPVNHRARFVRGTEENLRKISRTLSRQSVGVENIDAPAEICRGAIKGNQGTDR